MKSTVEDFLNSVDGGAFAGYSMIYWWRTAKRDLAAVRRIALITQNCFLATRKLEEISPKSLPCGGAIKLQRLSPNNR